MHYKTRLGRSTINSSFTFNSNNLIAYKLIPKKVFLEGEDWNEKQHYDYTLKLYYKKRKKPLKFAMRLQKKDYDFQKDSLDVMVSESAIFHAHHKCRTTPAPEK